MNNLQTEIFISASFYLLLHINVLKNVCLGDMNLNSEITLGNENCNINMNKTQCLHLIVSLVIKISVLISDTAVLLCFVLCFMGIFLLHWNNVTIILCPPTQQ